MRISHHDRMRMERAHVRAWPALNTAVIDGWLWRSSGGASQRANSTSTVEFTGADTAAAIDAVEARYKSIGTPARFHSYEHTAPAGLAEQLSSRGYTQCQARQQCSSGSNQLPPQQTWNAETMPGTSGTTSTLDRSATAAEP